MQKLQGKAKPSRIRRLTGGGAAARRLPGRAQSTRVRDIEVTIPVLVFIVARVLVYMIH